MRRYILELVIIGILLAIGVAGLGTLVYMRYMPPVVEETTVHVPEVNFNVTLSKTTTADKDTMIDSLIAKYPEANVIDVTRVLEDTYVLYVTVTIDGIDTFLQYYIEEDSWGNT